MRSCSRAMSSLAAVSVAFGQAHAADVREHLAVSIVRLPIFMAAP